MKVIRERLILRTIPNNTVDGERFAGLNIRGFSAIEVFAEIISRCLGHKQCITTHYLV